MEIALHCIGYGFVTLQALATRRCGRPLRPTLAACSCGGWNDWNGWVQGPTAVASGLATPAASRTLPSPLQVVGGRDGIRCDAMRILESQFQVHEALPARDADALYYALIVLTGTHA